MIRTIKIMRIVAIPGLLQKSFGAKKAFCSGGELLQITAVTNNSVLIPSTSMLVTAPQRVGLGEH